MLSELLKLLLLLLVFVINLPSCWSLCDISAARKQAHAGTCQKLQLPYNFAEDVAKRAADQAGVVFEKVLEAYKFRNKRRVHKKQKVINLCGNNFSTSASLDSVGLFKSSY